MKINMIFLGLILIVLNACDVTKSTFIETDNAETAKITEEEVQTQDSIETNNTEIVNKINKHFIWDTIGSLSSWTLEKVNYQQIKHNLKGDIYIAYTETYNYSIHVLKYEQNNGWIELERTGIETTKGKGLTLELDNEGVPYIAYYSTKGEIKKYVNNKWVSVGKAFSEGEAQGIKLKFNSQNIPHICFGDSKNKTQITLKKFTNSDWTTYSNGLPKVALVGDMAFNSKDELFLIIENIEVGNKTYHCFKFASNSWTDLKMPSNVKPTALYSSILFDKNDIMYLAYNDVTLDGNVSVVKYEADQWQSVGNPGISESSGYDVSISLNADNEPIILYGDHGVYGNYILKRFDSETWQSIGPSNGLEIKRNVFNTAAHFINEKPVVLFVNQDGKATVSQYQLAR